jgi:hypothetical protein
LVATYVAIEIPPAWTNSTSVYLLPTGVKFASFKLSVTESTMLVVVALTQTNVATIASPWCGFPASNPLPNLVPNSRSVPITRFSVLPFAE